MDKKILKEIFAGNLRKIRICKNLTQECLAEQADISQEYLARLESGKSNPSLFIAYNLSKALNVTLDLLISPNEN